MIEYLFKTFIPYTIAKDNVRASYAKNLVGACLISIIASPVYAIMYYYLNYADAIYFILPAEILMLSSLVVLKHTLSISFSSSVFVGAFTCLICVLSYNLGDIDAAVIVWLTLTPLIAAFTGGIRSGYIWCVISLIAMSLFYFLHYFHFTFPLSTITNPLLIQYVEIIGLTIVVTTLVAFYELNKLTGLKMLRNIAYVDSLTGLPNRLAYEVILAETIDRAEKNKSTFSIIHLDIDKFKEINIIYGKPIADLLLQEIVMRIKRYIQYTNIMARVGGDEFKVIVEKIQNREEMNEIANIILMCLKVPFTIQKHEITITASMGLAVFDNTNNSGQFVDQYVELALNKAKYSGGNNLQIFDETLASEEALRIELSGYLPDAIANNELSLNYQLQFDASNIKKITGIEVLLRWENNTYGEIPSDYFIPIAERIGVIPHLGDWVLKEACMQYMSWFRDGLVNNILIAVNISARQLYHPNFVDYVENTIKETGMMPANLELELTETEIITDIKRAIEVLTALKSLGVRIVIDDFGSGYTSLSYLTMLPVSGIKMDKSFLNNMLKTSEASIIIEAIIDLAHKVRLSVVAEGVETKDELVCLQKFKCDSIQGFYLSIPKDFKQTTDLLRSKIG